MVLMQEAGGVTYVTAEEMKAIDRDAVERCKIDVLSLMENAGVAVASTARRKLLGGLAGKRVACLVGKGNNGGDGLVAARHLRNWSAEVTIILGSGRDDLGEICAKQLSSVEAMRVPIADPSFPLNNFDLLIDALLGYNSKGDPRQPLGDLIRSANASGVPILAVDIPSGLDPDTGLPNDPCIIAHATVTLGLPKVGFLHRDARRFLGELFLADVSLPAGSYPRLGNPFSAEQVIRLA